MLLGQAARSRELSVRTLGPELVHPASVLSEAFDASFDDLEALESFTYEMDAATVEGVEVPASALMACSKNCIIAPPVASLECGQDRLKTKELCKQLKIPYAKAVLALHKEEVMEALSTIGLPLLLIPRMRTNEERSAHVLSHTDHVREAWEARDTRDWILEQFTNPEREIACMAARSSEGNVSSYPLVELLRSEGLVQQIIAPATDVSQSVANAAVAATSAILDHLEHVGVLCVTFFVRGNDLILDTITPTVHIAGLWTYEGSQTNQYENHIRALTGAELGPATTVVPCRTVRIFGFVPEAVHKLDADGVMVHLYGMGQQADDVCVGHVTIMGTDRPDFADRWKKLSKVLSI